MTFEIILSIAFLLMSIYSFAYVQNRIGVLLLIAIYMIATVFVWFPEYSTRLANYVGVGRGVDFVLIVSVVLILNVLMFVARYLYTLNRKLTLLVRHVALQSASSINSASENPDRQRGQAGK